jgi:nitrite reductase/ring-hydroxylating ferredoxin subunit/uncharacterized membrane protein
MTESAVGNAVLASVERVGNCSSLDAVAIPLRDAVARAIPPGAVKDALSGTWLGHPLHPMLTDLPIGFWTSAFTLDLVGGTAARKASTRLVGLGLLSAVPAALAGASDWADTSVQERRIGLAHALANGAATVAYLASWRARKQGRHLRGVALGLVGASAATVAGYLGGHLLQGLGLGVDHTAFTAGPTEWTPTIDVDAVVPTPTRVHAGEAAMLVFEHDTALVALAAQCPHRGAPMEEGALGPGTLTCPWHGSCFRLPDGALLRGPSAAPLPSYDCRVVDGRVEVRKRR